MSDPPLLEILRRQVDADPSLTGRDLIERTRSELLLTNAGAPLPRWRVALTSWLAIYPAITLIGAATLPLTSDLPWPLRTLLLTAILVPLVVYVTGPLTNRAVSVAVGAARAAVTNLQRGGRRQLPADTPDS